MSRIGIKPIDLPAGVEVSVNGNNVSIKGPKGTLSQKLDFGIKASVKDGKLIIESNGAKSLRKYHGLYRALLNNFVKGVTAGYAKELEIQGVGFRAQVSGKKLVLNIGYCHTVDLAIPDGVKVEAPTQTELTISGINKQLVGEFAAKIRDVREPEPYKGKGIRYKNERVRRKAGKAMA